MRLSNGREVTARSVITAVCMGPLVFIGWLAVHVWLGLYAGWKAGEQSLIEQFKVGE